MVVVEVRQGPLQDEEEEEKEEEAATNIKSNNPHLAGGEKKPFMVRPPFFKGQPLGLLGRSPG